jgi:putative endonuclease
MSNSRRTLGQRAENYVADALRRGGYAILARNWHHGKLGELDIVARRSDQIVFVEVRARRGPAQDAADWALASVGQRKQARLALLAEAFLTEHELADIAWRIDVAAVSCDGDTLSMEVITNAVAW